MVAGSAASALLAAYVLGGLSALPAAAQTQPPSTLNPMNPQDRTLTNPQDRTSPNAVNPQNRSTTPTPSPGGNLNGNRGLDSTTGVEGYTNINGNLNAKLGGPIPPGSTTLEQALEQAYFNNPTLNAQRAATRATDENVPTALAGYRPRVTGTSSLTDQYLENLVKNQNSMAASHWHCPRDLIGRSSCPTFPTYDKTQGTTAVTSAGLTVTQTLFNGFQTANRTRLAEGQVFSARETLRTSEQTILLNAATAYMNLLRDAAILELQRSNVNVLEVTLRQTRDRFNAGEVTRTDVAQAEARLSTGRSQLAQAEFELRLLARDLSAGDRRSSPRQAGSRRARRPVFAALAGRFDRPRTLAASDDYDRDVQRRCRDTTGQSGRRLALSDTVGHRLCPKAVWLDLGADRYRKPERLDLAAQLSVPLYQGGSEYAAIRQSKETLGQRRLELDNARDTVQQNVTQAWGQLEAAKAQVISTSSSVTASEIALNGVREEARVGQRTTLDVLNAQQELVNARTALVTAQRDRVVASYTLLATTGALSPQVLGLRIQVYDPTVHYHQVRDAWGGVRIPDGR